MTLHLASMGGGVVLQGAPGQRRIDELLEADSYEIGTRGALVAASDVSDYVLLDDDGAPIEPWTFLLGLLAVMPGFDQTKVLAVGYAANVGGGSGSFMVAPLAREGESSPVAFADQVFVATPTLGDQAVVITGYSWPGAWIITAGGGTQQVNVAFFCLGAREGTAPNFDAVYGLYVAIQAVGAATFHVQNIGDFNALGTGVNGDGIPLAGGGLDVGTKSQPLYFRGVIAYNNHAFGWGFDSADTVHGDGPARVMFSNLGTPLKYGNDNLDVAGVNRFFTDSDAIVLGGAGEIIRGAIVWATKLFFGTNAGLHYIGGYGRDSFLTDGFTPVMKAFNIVGPTALIEGPDKLLYGVSDQGLWSFDGVNVPVPLFEKLVDFDGKSPGYWDLIWTDPTQSPGYPGLTNQDLVWTAVDWQRHQVLIGIPFCNAATGAGQGNDTVVIKYHVRTGGFTRQVFPGVNYTAALYARREGQQRETRFIGTATAGHATIQSYGAPSGGPSAKMPTILPTATFGPFAPFGPDGRGSLKRLYATLAWETAGALPLQFRVTTTVDQAQSDDFLLTAANAPPAGPAVDDLWLDTSLTNTDLGNGSAGAITPAFPAALLNRWTGTSWEQLPGVGSNGQRAVIRLPLLPRNGTWWTMTFQCLAASGRYQFEALGQKPGGGSAAE